MTMFVSFDVPPNEASIARGVFFFFEKQFSGLSRLFHFRNVYMACEASEGNFLSQRKICQRVPFFTVRVSAAYARREIDNKCLDIVLDSINFSTFFSIATFRREEDNRKNAGFRSRSCLQHTRAFFVRQQVLLLSVNERWTKVKELLPGAKETNS